MLVLSRKPEQSFVLGDDVTITVLAIEGDRVKLGIDAPRSLTVLRTEVYRQVQAANADAAANQPSAASVAAALRARLAAATPARSRQ